MPVKYFLITGRVQGVGFRWFTHRIAAQIGLHGWVKNTDSGHVEVVARGSEDQLAELTAELRRGSHGSRVDSVIQRSIDNEETSSLEEFSIEGAW